MIRNNKWSLLSVLLILYLSLANADSFNRMQVIHFAGIDKVVHFCMYSFLTGVMLFENRKRILSVSSLILLAAVPLVLGALLEVLQSLLTTTRTGSFTDFLANAAGISFSVIVFLLFRKKKEGRLLI